MREPIIKEEPKSPTTPTNHTKIVRVAKRKVAVKTELCDQMAAQYGGVLGEKMKIEDSDNILENMDTRFDGEKNSIWLTASVKIEVFLLKINNNYYCTADI